jgi:hypothetical protein
MPANGDRKSAIVTIRRRGKRFADVPDMTPEEHKRRGDGADAMFPRDEAPDRREASLIGSGAPGAQRHAKAGEAHHQQRQRSGLRHRANSHGKAVSVRARAEGVDVNAGGETECGEALAGIPGRVGQGRPRGVARRDETKPGSPMSCWTATRSPVPVVALVKTRGPTLSGPLAPPYSTMPPAAPVTSVAKVGPTSGTVAPDAMLRSRPTEYRRHVPSGGTYFMTRAVAGRTVGRT